MITKYQTSWVIGLMQLSLVEVYKSHHLSFVYIITLVNLELFFAKELETSSPDSNVPPIPVNWHKKGE